MNQQPASAKPKLLDQVRTTIRMRRLSYRTEQAYVDWIKRFILFHGKRHPKDLGAPEIQHIFHIPYDICHLSLKRIRSADKQWNRRAGG